VIDINYAKAITYAYPAAQWVLYENDYEKLDWHDSDIQKPTKEELDAAWNDYLIYINTEIDPMLSALEKLKRLGLTEEEAKAIAGV